MCFQLTSKHEYRLLLGIALVHQILNILQLYSSNSSQLINQMLVYFGINFLLVLLWAIVKSTESTPFYVATVLQIPLIIFTIVVLISDFQWPHESFRRARHIAVILFQSAIIVLLLVMAVGRMKMKKSTSTTPRTGFDVVEPESNTSKISTVTESLSGGQATAKFYVDAVVVEEAK